MARNPLAFDRRIRLLVEYEGTGFVGWQRQVNGPSIQAALEEAVLAITGERLTVAGAGRTDAGVHALGQVAAFTTRSAIPPRGLLRGLNAVLPPAVAVLEATEAEPTFDPRRMARGKHYRYSIWNGEPRSPLRARTSWHIRDPIDAAAMDAAGRPLLGEHDFSAFRAADCDRKNPVRRIDRLEVRREGDLVTLEVEATAFLKHMVRIVVGTLADAGRGRATPEDVAGVLAGGDRTRAGPTAPPHGLTLVRVDYLEESGRLAP